MRLVVIVGRYPPVFGGATAPLRTLFSEMVRRGHEVAFLTPKYSPTHPEHEVYNGIHITRIPPGITSTSTEALFAIGAVMFLLRQDQKPQLLLDTIPYGMCMPFLEMYSTTRRTPLVARLSQIGANEPLDARKGISGVLKRLFSGRYDFTICVSSALADTCRRAGLQQIKYSRIFNCVDEARFSPAGSAAERLDGCKRLLPNAERPIVIVPGSVTARKRAHLAVEAWMVIKKEYAMDGTLVFVGPTESTGHQFDGDYVSKIIAAVAENNLQDSVYFTGLKDNIEDYYRASDILLFVSNREGLPNVLLEGMSCGLPIVCTRIASVTEDIIQDKVQGLYADDAPADIASRLAELMIDQGLRSRLSDHGRRTVAKTFGVRRIADEVEATFARLIAARTMRGEA